MVDGSFAVMRFGVGEIGREGVFFFEIGMEEASELIDLVLLVLFVLELVVDELL